MAKKKTVRRKAPVKRKRTKKAPGTSSIKSDVFNLTEETTPDYAAAGKHLAESIASLVKAIEAVGQKPSKTYTASWFGS